MKFDVTSASVREFADRVVSAHPGIDKPQALELAAHGFGYRNFDTLSGVLKKAGPGSKPMSEPFKLDKHIPLWVEGFVCDNEYAVFEWAKVVLTEAFLARVLKYRSLCGEAELLHLAVDDSPTEWYRDEESVIHDWQLFVNPTRFWFRGHPKHASFAVETRAVYFDDLFKLLKTPTEEDKSFRWIGGELYKDHTNAQRLCESIHEHDAEACGELTGAQKAEVPAQSSFPVLYDLDPGTKEATGTVAFYCCNRCRASSRPFSMASEGTSEIGDFGFVPQCEGCGEEVFSERKGSVRRHDWAIGEECEDGFPVYVDDRQLSYRPTPTTAKNYALEIIARLEADDDYRLNDKPAGFLPPPLKNA